MKIGEEVEGFRPIFFFKRRPLVKLSCWRRRPTHHRKSSPTKPEREEGAMQVVRERGIFVQNVLKIAFLT